MTVHDIIYSYNGVQTQCRVCQQLGSHLLAGMGHQVVGYCPPRIVYLGGLTGRNWGVWPNLLGYATNSMMYHLKMEDKPLKYYGSMGSKMINHWIWGFPYLTHPYYGDLWFTIMFSMRHSSLKFGWYSKVTMILFQIFTFWISSWSTSHFRIWGSHKILYFKCITLVIYRLLFVMQSKYNILVI